MPSIFSQFIMRGATEGFAEGLVSTLMKGAKGIWANGGQEAFKKAAEDLPNLFGIGFQEEAEFKNALNRLKPEDRKRVMRVKMRLSASHQKRWEMILATVSVEGIKHKLADGTEVDAKNTPSDPRVVDLQNIADMVREPGDNLDGTAIPPDSDDSAEFAAEYLRVTALYDKPFIDWLKQIIANAPDFLQKHGVKGLLWVTSFFVNPEELREILEQPVTEEQKVQWIEELLDNQLAMRQELIEAKVKRSRRARWLVLVPMVIFFALLAYASFG